MSAPRLLLFDLYTGGHHRAYLEMVARAWLESGHDGLLEIAAPGALFDAHPDFDAWLAEQDPARVRANPLELAQPLREGNMGLRDVLANDFQHGRTLTALVADRRPEHVLAMYFDHLQASLALRRVSGCRVSGIYFRPSFHYPAESLATRVRKLALLKATLKNPDVHRVLSLDPYAVARLEDPRVVWLPDGIDAGPPAEAADTVRGDWGIRPGSRVALFFGVTSARKGIHEVAAAVPHMGKDVTVLVAGRIPDGERAAVQAAMAPGIAAGQVIHVDRYVSDQEVSDLFGVANVALIPYRYHTGSSNVLIRAAAAGLPVVGPRYGLVGRLIREHELGISVEPESARKLAAAIDRAPQVFDRHKAHTFAEANTAQQFADTLFREVLG